jgi:GrpB-like predicted nucleotidyltransferase (UPF0157 family)/GNAT superfamily N-acetyltransferase
MQPCGMHKWVGSCQRQKVKSSMRKNSIEVVAYDSRWPEAFAGEASKMKEILGNNCLEVYHIGSTSIPGLAAKPIIDMIPVVKDITAIDRDALEAAGYEWRGECGMPFRGFCVKYNDQIQVHAHIWEEGHPEIDKHLLFRDYLLQHRQDLKTYESLKQKLAAQYPSDGLTYSLNKDDLVKEILAKTGFKGRLIVQALTTAEWQAYHRLRKELIFDMMGVEYDPNHHTIRAANQYHFVMSLGPTIIGFAQIELMDDNRAILRTIGIDPLYQSMGHGSWLLSQMERWIRQQGKTVIQLHSDTAAVAFYRRYSYKDMPFIEPEREITYPHVDLGKELAL